MEPVTKIRFEVINPANWTYVAVKDVTLTAPASGYRPYQKVTGVTWTVSARTVFFRVTAIGGLTTESQADLDDLTITCTGP